MSPATKYAMRSHPGPLIARSALVLPAQQALRYSTTRSPEGRCPGAGGTPWGCASESAADDSGAVDFTLDLALERRGR